MPPEPEIIPAEAAQVTDVFVVPLTVAVKLWLVPALMEVVDGAMLIETCAGAVTVTVAWADFLVSATLVAVTEYVPAVGGAV